MSELTKERILQMNPGKEFDKLVALEVMGWQIYHYDKDEAEKNYYMLMDDEMEPVADFEGYNIRQGERQTEEEAWNDNHKFSTDISAAWEVVEQLANRENWMLYRLGQTVEDDSIKFECTFLEIYRGVSGNARAAKAPEAICKAALLALLGSKLY